MAGGKLAVPDNCAVGGHHVFEGVHQSVGLGRLHEGDGASQQDDEDQDEAQVEVGQVLAGLYDEGDDAEDRAHPEQDAEPVGQLEQEPDPGRSLLLLGQLVVALLPVPL